MGVGTLYRRYPSRDALLEALTLRSFRLLVALAEEAEGREGDALARLDWYWDRVIDERDQLVLPLHGGPPVTADHVRAERARLHACLRRLLDAGRRDGSIRADVDTSDIVLFGAMLVAPLPGASDWDAVARRQKAIHLDGLRLDRRHSQRALRRRQRYQRDRLCLYITEQANPLSASDNGEGGMSAEMALWRFERGDATATEIQDVAREVLAELREPGSEASAAAVAAGLSPLTSPTPAPR